MQLGSESLFFFDLRNNTYYGQVGYSFTEKFSTIVQFESVRNRIKSVSFAHDAEHEELADRGIAFNYHFSPNLVLKAEYHDLDQELVGLIPVFGPRGFLLDPVAIPSNGGNYSILSFSVSF